MAGMPAILDFFLGKEQSKKFLHRQISGGALICEFLRDSAYWSCFCLSFRR